MISPRKPVTALFYRERLPHWEVVDGLYFVTIRVRGSIPAQGAQRIRDMNQLLEGETDRTKMDRIRRKIFREMEEWLDIVSDEKILSNPKAAEIVIEAIEHRHNSSAWHMIRYVVMQNHIHLFFSSDRKLKPLLRDFKRWTSTQIARMSDRQSLWQTEWFDHWSRSQAEDEKIIRYIQNNPVKAGLVADSVDWPYQGGATLLGIEPQ